MRRDEDACDVDDDDDDDGLSGARDGDRDVLTPRDRWG